MTTSRKQNWSPHHPTNPKHPDYQSGVVVSFDSLSVGMFASVSIFIILAAVAAAQDRGALWKKDVDFATVELAKRHKNLFARMTKSEWSASAIAAKKEFGEVLTQTRAKPALVRCVRGAGA
jgi:hypothetical protein